MSLNLCRQLETNKMCIDIAIFGKDILFAEILLL